MRSKQQFLVEQEKPLSLTRKLYSYSSTHIRSLCGWTTAWNTLRSRFSNNVKQDLAYLTCPGSYGSALLILDGVDTTVCVQWKDHWFCVHALETLLNLRGPLGTLKGAECPYNPLSLPRLEALSHRTRNTQQAGSKQQHACWFWNRVAGYLTLHRRDSIVGRRRHEVQRVVGNRVCNSADGHGRGSEINYTSAGITGRKSPAERRSKAIAAGGRDRLGDRESKCAIDSDSAGTAHEGLEVAEAGPSGGVQTGRTQASESDHDRIAHATQKSYRVSAAA